MTGEGYITVKMYFAPELFGNFVALPSPRSGLLPGGYVALLRFPQICLRQTSHIPKTLSEIARSPYESVYKAFKHFQ